MEHADSLILVLPVETVPLPVAEVVVIDTGDGALVIRGGAEEQPMTILTHRTF